MLQHVFKLTRPVIRPALDQLLRTRGIEVEDNEVWAAALAGWTRKDPDVIDLYLLERARSRGVPLRTFDGKLLKLPGARLP